MIADDARGPEVVVAVDLGGTLTKIAYVTSDGAATDVHRVDTRLDERGSVPPEWLARLVVDSAARPGVRPVGYGLVAPGIIDAEAGVVRVAPNVGWRDVPLRQVLDAGTGLPGTIGHDVRAGGLAEWRLGDVAGASDLLFLALGTGIAGASVVDGRMLQAGGYAGEIRAPARLGRRPVLRLRCVRVPGDRRLRGRGRASLPPHHRAPAERPGGR